MNIKKQQSGFALVLEIFIGLFVIGVIIFGLGAVMHKKSPNNPVSKIVSKVASNGDQKDPWGEPCHIKEEGRAQLTVSPIRFEDIEVISPMGAMVGGHVTPIDHMYFYPNSVPGNRFSAAVYAVADGRITAVQHRGDIFDGPPDARPGSDEYRMTIEQTCNQGYYYDLITKLAPDLKAKVGSLKDYGSKGLDEPVKAGQLIGYVGNQSLDFGVYDTKVNLNFIVPDHYKAEAWKIHTADAFSYFEPKLLASLLPKAVRTAEPRAGKIDYDKDGYLVGNWFEQGTNGYGGKDGRGGNGYWSGHLAIAYNSIDPKLVNISIGFLTDNKGEQFAVIGNSPDPATINQDSGLVKYQLTRWNYVLPNGSNWDRRTPNPDIKGQPGTSTSGTVLFQLTDKRLLKMEVFLGKSASQVNGFTSSAKTYER